MLRLCIAFAIMTSANERSKMFSVYHQGHEPITAIAFSPDGKLLAIGSDGRDKNIIIWDVAERKELRSLAGHQSDIEAVAFSSRGLLASASNDQTIRLWRVADGKTIGILKGHEERVTGVTFLGNGELVASCSVDKTIRIWQVDGGRLIRTLRQPDESRCLAYEPKKRLLACGGLHGRITVWDTTTWDKVRELPRRKFPVSSIAFSSDGATMASASSDYRPKWAGAVDLWSVATGKHLRTLDHPGVNAVSFLPDSPILASGGLCSHDHAHAIKLWDTKDYTLKAKLDEEQGYIMALAFAPRGHLLASGGGTSIGIRRVGELILWDLERLKK